MSLDKDDDTTNHGTYILESGSEKSVISREQPVVDQPVATVKTPVDDQPNVSIVSSLTESEAELISQKCGEGTLRNILRKQSLTKSENSKLDSVRTIKQELNTNMTESNEKTISTKKRKVDLNQEFLNSVQSYSQSTENEKPDDRINETYYSVRDLKLIFFSIFEIGKM